MKNKHTKYLKKYCQSLNGKTIVVTGATGTIGKAIVQHLLTLHANVIMAVRNLQKAEDFKKSLSSFFDVRKITIMKLDVSDIASINAFVEDIRSKSIHGLINNAGVLNAPLKHEKYEIHYITNFLGQMYLTLQLSSQLNVNEGSRIVFQSSLSYSFSSICWEDVQGYKCRGKIKKYARTKRLVNLTLLALKQDELKQYKNVTYTLVHPGVCASSIMSNFSKFFSVAGQFFGKLIFHSAQTAALPAVLALFKDVPDHKLLGPRIFGIWGKPKMRKLSKKLFEQNQLQKALQNLQKDLDGIL